MSTPITVGKARLSTITLITGGAIDNTTPLTVGSGNVNTLKVFVNPSNNREIAAVGVAPSAGVNANVTANGHTVQSLFVVSAPPPPPDGPSFGTWGDEIDPPSWAQG